MKLDPKNPPSRVIYTRQPGTRKVISLTPGKVYTVVDVNPRGNGTIVVQNDNGYRMSYSAIAFEPAI